MIAELAQFHFLRPLWLLLLLPALLLWHFTRRSSDTTRSWADVIDPALLRHLVVGGEAQRGLRPADLLLAAWVIGAVAVAGPTFRQVPSPFSSSAPPAMIVLKVTPSMTTPDLAPTRLDRARQKLADLLAARPGAATGLVAYAGSAHLVLPPTTDPNVVRQMAAALSPEVMPREGDDLGDALVLAGKVVGDGGSVLVMADTVAPDQAAALHPDSSTPVTFLALRPAGQEDAGMSEVASKLGAAIVATAPDDSDTAAVAARLAAHPVNNATGEAARWQEAGYWLTPLIALIALLWFRRGWVLS